MKKCDCKIMNTLGKYQKIWPWIGAAGYAIDGAEVVLKHTKWGKAHYKLRMLLHGAGAGLLCLGAGVHTVQAFATRGFEVIGEAELAPGENSVRFTLEDDDKYFMLLIRSGENEIRLTNLELLKE